MTSRLLPDLVDATSLEAGAVLELQRLTGQLKAVRRMARTLEVSLAEGGCCGAYGEAREHLEELRQLLGVYEQSCEVLRLRVTNMV